MSTLSDVSTGISLLRSLSLVVLLALTVICLTILYGPAFGNIDPSDFRTRWGPCVWAATITFGILAIARIIDLVVTSFRTVATTRRNNSEAFIVVIKIIHDALLSYGGLDVRHIEECLRDLGQSKSAVWIDDTARTARAAFIGRAQSAFTVRKTRDDYRNSMERSETKQYLDNARDRLIAALLGKRMPKLFDPEDGPTFWKWLRLRLRRPLSDLETSFEPAVIQESMATVGSASPLKQYSAADRARLDEALYKMFDAITKTAIPAHKDAEYNLIHNWETKLASQDAGPKYFIAEIDRIRAEAVGCHKALAQMIYQDYNYYRDELRNAVIEGRESQFFSGLDGFKSIVAALPPTTSLPQLRLLVGDNHDKFVKCVKDYAEWIREARENIKQKRNELQTLV